MSRRPPWSLLAVVAVGLLAGGCPSEDPAVVACENASCPPGTTIDLEAVSGKTCEPGQPVPTPVGGGATVPARCFGDSSCRYLCLPPRPCCGGEVWMAEYYSCDTPCCPDGTPPPCETGCGNHVCDPGEDATSCPADCAPTCGDRSCDHPETVDTCPEDCRGALDPGEACAAGTIEEIEEEGPDGTVRVKCVVGAGAGCDDERHVCGVGLFCSAAHICSLAGQCAVDEDCALQGLGDAAVCDLATNTCLCGTHSDCVAGSPPLADHEWIELALEAPGVLPVCHDGRCGVVDCLGNAFFDVDLQTGRELPGPRHTTVGGRMREPDACDLCFTGVLLAGADGGMARTLGAACYDTDENSGHASAAVGLPCDEATYVGCPAGTCRDGACLPWDPTLDRFPCPCGRFGTVFEEGHFEDPEGPTGGEAYFPGHIATTDCDDGQWVCECVAVDGPGLCFQTYWDGVDPRKLRLEPQVIQRPDGMGIPVSCEGPADCLDNDRQVLCLVTGGGDHCLGYDPHAR